MDPWAAIRLLGVPPAGRDPASGGILGPLLAGRAGLSPVPETGGAFPANGCFASTFPDLQDRAPLALDTWFLVTSGYNPSAIRPWAARWGRIAMTETNPTAR
jgi:hypothetical protein